MENPDARVLNLLRTLEAVSYTGTALLKALNECGGYPLTFLCWASAGQNTPANDWSLEEADALHRAACAFEKALEKAAASRPKPIITRLAFCRSAAIRG